MFRESMLTGQVHGHLDWVNHSNTEIGIYVRTNPRAGEEPKSHRVVAAGPKIVSLLKQGVLQKGMMVTVAGEAYGRYYLSREGTPVPEYVIVADRVLAETPLEIRFRSSIYTTVKSVVKWWDPDSRMVRTYLNFDKPGYPSQLSCSFYLGRFVASLSEQSQQNFLKSVEKGREFVALCMTDIGYYTSREGETVPQLMLLPLDFKLQG